MLPWIALAAGVLANAQAKKAAKRQALESALISRAENLGANMAPARAMQQRREIDRQPLVNPQQLISAIGSTADTEESVDDRLAREMARRGLMRGYEPF